jgi:hypothetical protein
MHFLAFPPEKLHYNAVFNCSTCPLRRSALFCARRVVC